MRVFIWLCLSLIPLCAMAQESAFTLDTTTPEGKLLTEASQQSDEAKKQELLEKFLAEHPKHAGAGYAWSQLVPLYLKHEQYDKTITGAEAVLAVEPENSPIGYNALQACEKKKDAACIKTWSLRTMEAADKTLAKPKPSDEKAAEEWAQNQDYAKQVILRCEYALFAGVLAANDPATVIDLSKTLETRNPESQYFPQIGAKYALALQQTGAKDEAGRVAERIIAKDKTNEDVIVVAANYYLQSKTHPEKVVEYSELLVQLMGEKAAPQGADPAAWETKKNNLLGLGHWMSGMAYAQQNQWEKTDKAFRDALPFIKGNNELLSSAYFHLGLANYNLSKSNPKLRAEAKRFNELCSKINGPYQAQALKNLKSINLGK